MPKARIRIPNGKQDKVMEVLAKHAQRHPECKYTLSGPDGRWVFTGREFCDWKKRN